jgi:phosphoserine / homoserine phosphotransferase
MKVVCLDMEGVLTPEIWQHVARRAGIAELNLTTRDVKDYHDLMRLRIEICHKHDMTLERIQAFITELNVFEGAREFCDWIRERYELVILSDTYYEFAGHFMRQLGRPTLFCHAISYNAKTRKLEYALRQENSKGEAVKALRSLNFRTVGIGDSYNDIHMLREAHAASFYHAPDNVKADFPQFGNLATYAELKDFIAGNL